MNPILDLQHEILRILSFEHDCQSSINWIFLFILVPLLISKGVIKQVLPLHNSEDLDYLKKNWVQAFFSKQPLGNCFPCHVRFSIWNDNWNDSSKRYMENIHFRVPTEPGKPWKMTVHLEKFGILVIFNKKSWKMAWNLKKTGWTLSAKLFTSCLGVETMQSTLNCWNRLERKVFRFGV